MSTHYQKFLKVLENWPVDKSKVGSSANTEVAEELYREIINLDSIFFCYFRDFGEHLRKRVKYLVNPINLTAETSDSLTKQIESLEKLSNNIHGKNYKRLFTSTATGLSAEQCSQVLSSEFLQYLNEDKNSKSKF